MVMSAGTLGGEAISSISAGDGSATVSLAFPNSAGTGNRLGTDLVTGVVVNTNGQIIGFSSGTDLRSGGSVAVTMPEAVATGDLLRAYLMFRRPDGSIVSDSSTDSTTV